MSCRKKPAKKKMVRITMEVKKEIVEKYETGLRIRELSAAYGMPRTTISTIVKNKDVIKSANVAKGVKSITKQRSETLEHVEKLLLIWITEKQRAGDTVSEAMICEKAKVLHTDLLNAAAGTSRVNEVFKASHGWFDNFKKRTGLHVVGRHGADKDAAQEFVTQFREFVKKEGLHPEQVFNCDETLLFWKKMPNSAPRERLTLLFCGNASGDHKVKPLLIYHSEFKAQASVMWRTNTNARINRELFTEWFHTEFGPGVKSYLRKKNLPLKAFLIMDNSPIHPPSLEEYIPPEFDFITVKFLPPNTGTLLQPMNQEIITDFKKLYTKSLFQLCYEVTSDTETTLTEFWEDFSIGDCVTLVDKAWREVSPRTMNSAWRNLWPEVVTDTEFEGVSTVDIESLGKSMGLDMDDLMDEHKEELTTKDLQELEKEEAKKNRVITISSDSEEEVEEPPIEVIKEMLSKWADVKNFAVKYHPNKSQTVRNGACWNDQTMSHFRNILKRRTSSSKLKSEKTDFLVPQVLIEVDFNR